MSELISSRVSWMGLLVMLVGLFAINEACHRVAARRRVQGPENRASEVDFVVAAVLGLLALLLAFSFDMGEERFVKHRDLVLDEANAIATTYLRADMLPAPQGERIRGSTSANTRSAIPAHRSTRTACRHPRCSDATHVESSS